MTATKDPTQFLRPEASPGAIYREVIAHLADIPGFFNEDDAMHFFLVLTMQTHMGLHGDMLEIGSYHGRSSALLAYCLQPSERLVVSDVFESEGDGRYTDKPTPDDLMRNILRVVPSLDPASLDIRSGLSTSLRLEPEQRFRFAHIDGAHDADTAHHDIALASRHMLAHGVIAIDDYHHPDWPGVTDAADRFLSENPDWHPIADMNRHIAKGRKLYLARTPNG
ncbi:MAG: class I SAM-dependent methyltransferase [Phycisphaerales bacterium JB043]